jgi:hypothetical protein
VQEIRMTFRSQSLSLSSCLLSFSLFVVCSWSQAESQLRQFSIRPQDNLQETSSTQAVIKPLLSDVSQAGRVVVSRTTQKSTQGGRFYFVDVEFGTPAQSLELIVDTGSSDTWVYGKNYCSRPALQCCKYRRKRSSRIYNAWLETARSRIAYCPFADGILHQFGDQLHRSFCHARRASMQATAEPTSMAFSSVITRP